ncbi:MAG: MotE family protein [Nitrospirales bacterium]
MFPSRIVTVWIGLALALAMFVVIPVYGTGSEKQASPSGTKAENSHSSDVRADAQADATALASMASSQAAEPQASLPEMTLVEKLQARLQQLEEREQRIQDEEQRLGVLRRDLEQMATRQEKAIAEAMAIREAQNESGGEDDGSQKSLKHLIKVYEAMDPDEAALRISKMKEPLALDILAGIKEKKAAGMLAGIEPVKAAKLTEGLRYYHQRKRTATP